MRGRKVSGPRTNNTLAALAALARAGQNNWNSAMPISTKNRSCAPPSSQTFKETTNIPLIEENGRKNPVWSFSQGARFAWRNTECKKRPYRWASFRYPEPALSSRSAYYLSQVTPVPCAHAKMPTKLGSLGFIHLFKPHQQSFVILI